MPAAQLYLKTNITSADTEKLGVFYQLIEQCLGDYKISNEEYSVEIRHNSDPLSFWLTITNQEPQTIIQAAAIIIAVITANPTFLKTALDVIAQIATIGSFVAQISEFNKSKKKTATSECSDVTDEDVKYVQKKNEIFTIIETCHTPEFNFDTTIQGLGYTRSFSECFEIDSNGYFGESVLITEYILKNINDEIENIAPDENAFYSLLDFSKALEFTLISEGFLHNDTLVDDASILKVRLTTILHSEVGNYFDGTKHYTNNEFIDALKSFNGKKAQIININLEDVDDIYAKVIVKIMCKFLFDYSKSLEQRASIPFHLFLEEAHRYIQKDNDTFLLGYNIFDRIAKEGRKYGVILDIISQRPVEISDTVIAQCSNFLIFKMTHPLDIKYISEMLPNISADIIEKQKTLQPGTCVSFGSAFKIPMIVKMEMPNPMPYSSNCNVSSCWR